MGSVHANEVKGTTWGNKNRGVRCETCTIKSLGLSYIQQPLLKARISKPRSILQKDRKMNGSSPRVCQSHVVLWRFVDYLTICSSVTLDREVRADGTVMWMISHIVIAGVVMYRSEISSRPFSQFDRDWWSLEVDCQPWKGIPASDMFPGLPHPHFVALLMCTELGTSSTSRGMLFMLECLCSITRTKSWRSIFDLESFRCPTHNPVRLETSTHAASNRAISNLSHSRKASHI